MFTNQDIEQHYTIAINLTLIEIQCITIFLWHLLPFLINMLTNQDIEQHYSIAINLTLVKIHCIVIF